MAIGICSSSDVDRANKDHGGIATKCGCGCISDLSSITTHSSSSSLLPLLPSPKSYFCHIKESRNHKAMAMGDIFYGGDDSEEINDHTYYKQDVLECMRKEIEFKAIKKRRKRKGCFFRCFEFFRLLFGCFKF
ncbi:hypothetical protein RIF29_32700 [Crotalaria pallida]|uniref:Uncharacterized protein n=1 Tax=Crotalaria pallida TaxID=3830 RepID=A0AAN9HXU7_CROPI